MKIAMSAESAAELTMSNISRRPLQNSAAVASGSAAAPMHAQPSDATGKAELIDIPATMPHEPLVAQVERCTYGRWRTIEKAIKDRERHL